MLEDEGEGGAEQFELEQLRRTTTTNTSLLPLLHSFSAATGNNNNTFHHIPLIHPPPPPNTYNNNPSTSNSQFQTQTHFFPPSILLPPHHSPTFNSNSNSINFQIQTPPPPFIDSTWTNHELVALFKITSTIHNFFPDQLITWDHVSRKLAEIGINKSAENCKDKFEDDNISSFFKIHNNHNYPPRFISELQDLYQGGVSVDEQQNSHEKKNTQQNQEEHSRDNDDTDMVVVTKQCDYEDDKVMEKSKRKRKRRNRFEMLKSFCETVVNKMMAQQEEIHNKLLEDMIKRDQEKLAREEEWKNQEIERMKMMAQEQAIASDRQSTIIHFLNKYLGGDGNNKNTKECSSSKVNLQNPNLPSNNNLEVESTPSSSNVIAQVHNPSSSETVVESNYTSTLVVPTIMEKLEDRRRWPRDEVLALINLKSTTSVINRSNNVEEKEGNSNNKGPLWERISEGMLEMGYKRSAKRCKEKWENINKYFKKTKDVVNKKKRSLDSRTCPYFHQLSSLYNQQQEKLIVQSQSQLVTNPISNSADQVDDQPQAQSSDSPVGSSVV